MGEGRPGKRRKRDRRPYMKHYAAGLQFVVFVLVGTLGGSYLDRKYFDSSGTGIVTILGITLGMVGGCYFLFKDFLLQGRRGRK